MRIEWVHLRLDRWALWVARGKRGGGVGSGLHPMWRDMPRDDQAAAQPTVPLSDDECWQTDQSIMALGRIDPALAETVACYYLRGSMAARDQMRISQATLSQRLDRAHRRFAGEWAKVGPVEQSRPTAWR